MIRRSHILASVAALTLTSAGGAMAAGTDAGNIITNSFSLSYTSGGDTITNSDVDSVQTTVDQKVVYALAPEFSGAIQPAQPGRSEVALPFTLENTGNGDTRFDVDVTHTPDPGNEINLTYDPNGGPGTWRVVTTPSSNIDQNGKIIDPNNVQSYDPNGVVPIVLAPDSDITIAILADIPDTNDGAKDDFTLNIRPINAAGQPLAEDRDGQGVDVVYADPSQQSGATGAGGYQIQAPILTATKTLLMVSELPAQGFDCSIDGIPQEGGFFVPGACVEYVIEVSNDASASSSAPDLAVTDDLPANLNHEGIINEGFDEVEMPGGPTMIGREAILEPGETVRLRVRATIQ